MVASASVLRVIFWVYLGVVLVPVCRGVVAGGGLVAVRSWNLRGVGGRYFCGYAALGRGKGHRSKADRG